MLCKENAQMRAVKLKVFLRMPLEPITLDSNRNTDIKYRWGLSPC